MDKELEDLVAKQAITEIIYRYCRAVDRMDRGMALSLWHPDAIVDFGSLYRGSAPGFVDRIWEMHATAQGRSHQVTNILINISGDKAVSESYVLGALRFGDETGGSIQTTGWSRYLDRWSRRDGKWAIDHRLCVVDFTEMRPVVDPPRDFGMPIMGRVDRDDPSFAFIRPFDTPL